MKNIFVTSVLVALICLSTRPQINAQTKPEAATAVKSMTMVGTVSSGGKSFVSDKDRKSWGVTNPDALKDHTGLHVSITAQVDVAGIRYGAISQDCDTDDRDTQRRPSQKVAASAPRATTQSGNSSKLSRLRHRLRFNYR